MTKIAHAFLFSTLLLGCAAPDAGVERSTPSPAAPQSDSAGQESDWLDSSPTDATTQNPPSEEAVPVLAACSYRSDFEGSITPGEGHWGTWAQCFDWCPDGTYGVTLAHKSESPRGSGDDTALNGVKLTCLIPPSLAPTSGSRTSSTGGWGSWLAAAQSCPGETAITSVRMKIEAPQGGGDDTGANRLEFKCQDDVARSPDAYTSWGAWGEWKTCPAGQAVCGIRTRVESSQGSGDDSALNGVEFACCTR